MRSGILRTHVATLRLRADAPFPSQLRRPGRWLRLRALDGRCAQNCAHDAKNSNGIKAGTCDLKSLG